MTRDIRERIGPWLAKKAILHRMGIAPEELILFDVGANIGEITHRYDRMWPGCTIYSFECGPEARRHLRGRFAGNAHIIVEAYAVTENAEDRRTFRMGGSGDEMSSLLPRASGRRYFGHPLTMQTEVETISLDVYCKRKAIERIHVLKSDIQGGELLLLKGARKLLKDQVIDLIYMEVFFVPMYEGAPLFWELCQFLRAYGYTLFDLYTFGRSRVSRQLKYGDALWVSSAVRRDIIDQLPPEWLKTSWGALESVV